MRESRAAILALLLVLTGCSTPVPEPVSLPDQQRAVRVSEQQGRQQAEINRTVRAFQNCVLTSAHTQAATTRDRNMAVEQAFTACQTEEQQLRALMTTLRLTQPMIETIVASQRTELKNNLVGADHNAR